MFLEIWTGAVLFVGSAAAGVALPGVLPVAASVGPFAAGIAAPAGCETAPAVLSAPAAASVSAVVAAVEMLWWLFRRNAGCRRRGQTASPFQQPF